MFEFEPVPCREIKATSHTNPAGHVLWPCRDYENEIKKGECVHQAFVQKGFSRRCILVVGLIFSIMIFLLSGDIVFVGD